jgi:hypothetical protein
VNGMVYLYGFAPADAALPGHGLEGVAGGAVELLPMDGFQIVASSVPAEEFAPEVLEARLQDLAWVARHGVAHERVVAWFVDHARILPVRLFTLYTSRDALQAEAAARAADLIEALRHFDGVREWDLKVGYDAERLTDHLGELSEEVAALDAELAAASPGRRYLLERKRQDLVRVEVGRAARQAAEALLEEAAHHARAVQRLGLPRGEVELPVVLSAALLVERASEEELRRLMAGRVAALQPLGVHASFSGPWAPYRFLAEAT